MRITNKKRVVIEHNGGQGAYGNALVQGEFLGRRYYDLVEVCYMLGMTPDEVERTDQNAAWNADVGVSYAEKIEHELEPVLTRGKLVE